MVTWFVPGLRIIIVFCTDLRNGMEKPSKWDYSQVSQAGFQATKSLGVLWKYSPSNLQGCDVVNPMPYTIPKIIIKRVVETIPLVRSTRPGKHTKSY